MTCFVFRPNHPAGCFEPRGPDRDVEMVTYVGHHPPAYYATVGFLSRWFTPGRAQVLAMRAVGALAVAALLASSLATLRRFAAPMWAGTGAAIALSPMVLFLAGVVSPSGIETGAALGVWVHGAALATDGDGLVDARVVDRLGIAAAVLVLSRALSPLWLAVIGLVLILLTTRARLVDVLRTRRVQVWGGVVVACLGVQAWWYFYADPLGHFVGTPVHDSVGAMVRTSIGKLPQLLHEMVGVFGWLDTRSPSITYYVWVLALGALVGLAITFATARFVRAIIAATVAALALPVVIETLGAGEAGFIWQGRYSLPLAVGVPLLAGIALGVERDHSRRRAPLAGGAGRRAHRRPGRRICAGLAAVCGRPERVAVVLLRLPVGTADPCVAPHRAVRIAHGRHALVDRLRPSGR